MIRSERLGWEVMRLEVSSARRGASKKASDGLATLAFAPSLNSRSRQTGGAARGLSHTSSNWKTGC